MEFAGDFNKTLGLTIDGGLSAQLLAAVNRLEGLAQRTAHTMGSGVRADGSVATNARAAAAATAKQAQAARDVLRVQNEQVKASKTLSAETQRQAAQAARLARQMENAASATRRVAAYLQAARMRGEAPTLRGMLGVAANTPTVQSIRTWGTGLQARGGMLGGAGGFAARFAAPIGLGLSALQGVAAIAQSIQGTLVLGGLMFLRLSRTIHEYWSRILQSIVGVGAKLAEATVSMVQQAASLESLQSRLEAVFRDQAPVMLKNIVEWAQKVPYTIDDMISAFIRLKASGVSGALGDINRAFKAASDLAVTFKVDVETAVKGLQGVYAGRMDIFTRRFGIRAPQLVPFGATLRPNTGGLESSPGVREKNLLAAVRYVEANFGSATERMANNLEQLMTNIEDLWLRFALTLKETGITDVVGGAVKAAMALFDQLEKDQLTNTWANTITAAYQKLQPLVLDLLERAPYIVTAGINAFYSIYDRAVTLYDRLGGVDAVYAIALNLLTASDKIAAAITEVVPVLTALLPNLLNLFQGLTKVVLSVWGMILRATDTLTAEPGKQPMKRALLLAAGISVGPSAAAAQTGMQWARDTGGITSRDLQTTAKSLDDLSGSLEKMLTEVNASLQQNITTVRDATGRAVGFRATESPSYMSLQQYAGWRKSKTALGSTLDAGLAEGVVPGGRSAAFFGKGVMGAVPTSDLDYYDRVEGSVERGTYQGTKAALADAGISGDGVGGAALPSGVPAGVYNPRWRSSQFWGMQGGPRAAGWQERDAEIQARNEQIAASSYGMNAGQVGWLMALGGIDTAHQNYVRRDRGWGRRIATTGGGVIARQNARMAAARKALDQNNFGWGNSNYEEGASAARVIESTEEWMGVPPESSSRARSLEALQEHLRETQGPVVINVDARGATDPAAVEAAARRGSQSAVQTLRQHAR